MNNIAYFERVLSILVAVRDLPIATTENLVGVLEFKISLRTAQRYLRALEDAGYVKRVSSITWGDFDRFFLTDKAINLIGCGK